MWIIGDGGSPERAQDNTRASLELAIAEWADGVLVHLRQTRDHLLVLSRLEKLRTAQGDHSLETLDTDTLKELKPVHPGTGKPYPLLFLPELLGWIGTDPIRAFIEPSGTLLDDRETLDRLGQTLLATPTRIPAFLVLPAGLTAPAGLPESRIWRTIRQEADLPPLKNRPGTQAIVPLALALSGQCGGLARILVTTTGPVPELDRLRQIPGFWGVVTPTPYFTRKAATSVPPGATP